MRPWPCATAASPPPRRLVGTVATACRTGARQTRPELWMCTAVPSLSWQPIRCPVPGCRTGACTAPCRSCRLRRRATRRPNGTRCAAACSWRSSACTVIGQPRTIRWQPHAPTTVRRCCRCQSGRPANGGVGTWTTNWHRHARCSLPPNCCRPTASDGGTWQGSAQEQERGARGGNGEVRDRHGQCVQISIAARTGAR